MLDLPKANIINFKSATWLICFNYYIDFLQLLNLPLLPTKNIATINSKLINIAAGKIMVFLVFEGLEIKHMDEICFVDYFSR